ncbi:HAD family acid phosphatase [Streptomyces sp. NPDC059153]|uniref:phosphatase domain-containing protein n=1 Tax=Streptomyces sp. NPDC059153 TaxID=3346743 RepID=UPI0036B2E951
MRSDHRPLAVFDLDGTLADTGHRQHHLEGRRRDWNGFFSAAVDDPPLPEGVRLVLSSAEECEVRYLTGRPERCRRDTVAWLAEQGLPEARLYMRRNDDRRPARHTKLEILKRLGREYVVRMLVDDDELVCDAAEQAGFTVVRARWMKVSPALEDAQERAGRT